ncbi:MAG: FG-GAP repeat protein [Phycisphaerales bacterium]
MWFKSSFTTLAVAAFCFCSIGGTTPTYADLGDQLFKLLPDDGASSDWFGHSVAISNTKAIVGVPLDDDNGFASGSAYLFDTSTGAQMVKLLADDGSDLDSFGTSVAITGPPGNEIAIVGASLDDENGFLSGSAYLFDSTTGQQIAKLLHDDGAAFDRFGTSVAISGITAIVGVPGDDEASGSAFLFYAATGQQIGKLLPDDGAADDHFGVSVAISGHAGKEVAIVGAWWDDDNGVKSGSAYLFDLTTRMQIAKLLPDDGAADDHFGVSVAIGGPPGKEVAIVGADRNDDNGEDSGSAYLFDAARTPSCIWDLDDSGDVGASDLLALLAAWGPCKGCPADFDGNGTVGASDLLALLVNWGPCP